MLSDDSKNSITLENPLIMVTDQKVASLQEILPVLEKVVQNSKPLLIIADDIENEAVSTLIVNKLRGTFNVVATKAPGFGDSERENLSDIACFVGAKFYSKDLVMNLKDMAYEDLGTAKKVIITKDSTTIIEGAGSKEEVNAQIEEIRTKMNETTSEYDKKRLHERMAKLTGGVALIKVGAMTESELKEKKLRLEDALNATRAAISEGIVIGGGCALVEIYNQVKNEIKSDVTDVERGIHVVLDSLTEPMYQIAENSGFDGKDILEKQFTQKENVGFDAKNGVFVDMLQEGIVDPTKVTRSALLNASSIAGLFITTEAAIATKKEKNPAPAVQPNMYD
jgi:chaperonin GroEL